MSASHWVNYLSEVGRPLIVQGNDQEALRYRILDATRALETLKEEYRRNENTIQTTVAEDWDPEDILAAKLKAIQSGYDDSQILKH